MVPTRVLHVEDDGIQRALVAQYLTTPGEAKYVVTGVESEDEAVDTFRSGGVDLVILDYQLAQGNGLSCLRQLRQLDPLVPVIALSGVATPGDRRRVDRGRRRRLPQQISMDRQILTESIEISMTRARYIRAQVNVPTPPEDQRPIQQQPAERSPVASLFTPE